MVFHFFKWKAGCMVVFLNRPWPLIYLGGGVETMSLGLPILTYVKKEKLAMLFNSSCNGFDCWISIERNFADNNSIYID